MTTKILKFGGTSMGSTDSLKNVVSIIQKNKEQDIEQVVVCSAMSQVTNQLLAAGDMAVAGQKAAALEIFECIKDKHFEVAKDFGVTTEFESAAGDLMKSLKNFLIGVSMIHELSDRSLAYLSSYGERLSTRLLTCILEVQDISAVQLDSDFIKTKGVNFLEDEIDWDETRVEGKPLLKTAAKSKKVPIITGFFGTNQHGTISLLGRGGSDFSAAILAVIYGCKVVEIWTDVDGFMSADPRLVKNARVLEEIGFKEASELCFFGAKVLHPRTIRPVILNGGGEVWIKNTFNHEALGTRITEHAKALDRPVLSLSSKKVALLSLDLFAADGNKHRAEVFYELFKVIKDHKVAVDAVAASEAMISFCIEEKYLEREGLIESIENISPLEVRRDRSILCIVSPENAVYNMHGVLAQIFAAIATAGVSVEMDSENASEVGQLVVVKNVDVPKAIKTIHEHLIA